MEILAEEEKEQWGKEDFEQINDREGMDVKWKEEFQGFFQKAESRVLQEEAELSTEETD